MVGMDNQPVAWFGIVVSSFVLQHSWKRFVRQPESKGRKVNDRVSRASIRQKFSPKKDIPDDIDVVVIGSGMGGLSCAAVLARLGKKVLVLEQHNDVAGGGTHQFDLQGYRFDSGLHYTVPWSVPIFALTCGKKDTDVCQFDLMGAGDSTVDKIHLHSTVAAPSTVAPPFNMKLHEKHMDALYSAFPDERNGIDEFMSLSDKAMLFVKVFIAMRLFPRWLQRMLWNIVPGSILKVVSCTSEDILPTLTSDKRLMSLLSSMWIDTGARPDRASFMMTAAVFRGVSMEGGCYPAEGAEAMAIELANVITNHGGSILVRARVNEIMVEGGRVVGVSVSRAPTNGVMSAAGAAYSSASTVITCRSVVAACGYTNTFGRLISAETLQQFRIPRALPVDQSAGFVMANIGISGVNPSDVDITNTNTWHIPIDESGDAFGPMRDFFSAPLAGSPADGHLRTPTFITFPSLKDKQWSANHPGKISCQMLVMAEYDWFDEFGRGMKECARRGDATGLDGWVKKYEATKELWRQRAVQLLCHYYPKVADKIDFSDISTPLCIENYLAADRGGAVGIDVTPRRFVDPEVRDRLDCVTDIPGLYLTGQDTVLCGVTLCQLSGVITALRMEGLFAGIKILLQAIYA